MLCVSAFAAKAAHDAQALLAKAHEAYVANRESEKYWNWTSVTTRSILDKNGALLEEIPSVTVESPIQSDGKRCNALLAWGDGEKPYLADADADRRCTVEQEIRSEFQVETLLEIGQVSVESRSADSIVLKLRKNKEQLQSDDLARSCAAAMEGRITLDPATYFPRILDLRVSESTCRVAREAPLHYDGGAAVKAISSLSQGATIRNEYEFLRDKNGVAAKDHWMATKTHSVRPIKDNTQNFIVWGRRFQLTEGQKGRHIVVDTKTTATELTTDSVIKFTDPK